MPRARHGDTSSAVVARGYRPRATVEPGATAEARTLMRRLPKGLEDIRDSRVLEAMRQVDRRLFVPEEMRRHAEEDRALSIGFGQTISQPYVVALMSEHLDLRGTERVLEVGTGSGYQAAILGLLAKEVYSIEIIPELAQRASELLQRLGYSNVHVRCGDGYAGWPEYAPFEAIIVTCAPDHVPEPLLDQLAEGGRLVIPVGPWPKEQTLFEYRKREGQITEHRMIPVSFVPMTRRSP